MREYQDIWERLKSMPVNTALTQGIRVSANKAFHKRIIKAVKKEKWQDLGFKLDLDTQTAELKIHTSGSIITFYLIRSVSLAALEEL